jgi:hypothetical protein
MNDRDILKIGKSMFWFSFLVGSIIFFGLFSCFMMTFIVFGWLILFLFALANTFVFFGLIIYGLTHQSKFEVSIKSASILMINIPISFIYGCLINY